MPMTLWNEAYFDEITQGLQHVDPDFHHFCLVASKEALTQRIREDGTAVEWRLKHVEQCTDAFRSEKFAQHILVDGKTPEEIATEIMHSMDTPLVSAFSGLENLS